jgi:hypothetical protein
MLRRMPPIVAVSLVVALAVGSAADEPVPDGAQLYFEHCAACHGIGGGGDGPDANLFLPGPRNLHRGLVDDRETSELVRLNLEGAARWPSTRRHWPRASRIPRLS